MDEKVAHIVATRGPRRPSGPSRIWRLRSGSGGKYGGTGSILKEILASRSQLDDRYVPQDLKRLAVEMGYTVISIFVGGRVQ